MPVRRSLHQSRTREVPHLTPTARLDHKRCYRAKLWLIAIFCALRAVEGVYYFVARESDKFRLTGAIIVYILWTTASLVGIWLRHNWARYALIIFLLLGMVGVLFVFLAVALQTGAVNWRMAVPIAGVLIKGAIACFLIASEDIRRLVRHSRY